MIKMILFIILIIFFPVLILILVRGKSDKKSTFDQSCKLDSDCLSGLICLDEKCNTRPCEKPKAPTGLLKVEAQGEEGVDVTIIWSWVPGADAYLIFMGETWNFDPYESAIYSTISKESNRLFEGLHYGETVYVKIISISNSCGLSEPSAPLEFTTMSES